MLIKQTNSKKDTKNETKINKSQMFHNFKEKNP